MVVLILLMFDDMILSYHVKWYVNNNNIFEFINKRSKALTVDEEHRTH